MTDFAYYKAQNDAIFKRLKTSIFDKLYMLGTTKLVLETNKNADTFPLEHQFVKTKNLHNYIAQHNLHLKVFLLLWFLTVDGVIV